MSDKVRRLATMAVLVAVLAVCSQLAVPVGNVPITAQTAAVMLIALLLSPKYAALTIAVYILAGGIGLPLTSRAASARCWGRRAAIFMGLWFRRLLFL